MPNVPVTFSGDASGVAGAAAAAQAAIDSVHGKTETVEINVKVNGARDAASALDQHAAASGRAAAGARDHAAASDRAGASVRNHADAAERASTANRDHASSSQDASRSLDRHAQSSERATQAVQANAQATGNAAAAASGHAAATSDAGKGLDRTAVAADRSAGAHQGLFSQLKQDFWSGAASQLKSMAASHDAAGTSFQTTGIRAALGAAFINRMASSAAAAGKESNDAGKGLSSFSRSGDDASRTASGLGRSLGGLGDTVDGVGGGVSGLTKGINSLGEASSSINIVGTASSAVSTLGMAAAYSAAGSGVLTGAVAALGAVGVGALGGVGVAAGLAGGAMANFTADAQKDSAKFGDTFKQMGGQAHLGAQMISEPMADAMVSMGRTMVNAQNQMTPAGMGIATSLKTGFAEAASVITGNSDAIVGAAGAAASGFARLTGEAAPGVSAFLGQLPGLTQGAISGMSQVTSEFGRASSNIEGATPALNRMMGSIGGLGAELVHIGSGSMTPLAEDMSAMTRSATRMATQLEPAIKPSMSAFTDLASAGMGALGGLAPEISDFAGTLSQNAGPMGSVVDSLGRGMLSMGSAAVNGLGMAAPAIAGMADSIQANQGPLTDFIGGLVGGAADVVGAGADIAGGLSGGMGSFDSWGSKLSDATGGPMAPPGSLNAGTIEHNVGSYLNPAGAFKEAFGVGQPGGGGVAPVGPAAPGIADQRATGMGNMAAKAGMAPQASTISAPVPAAQVATGAAQVGAGAAPAFNASPVNPGAMAVGAGGFGAAASQMQSLGQAAQAAHAPVAQVGAAMASGAAQVSAAPMAAAMSKTVSRAVDVGAGAAAAGGASVGGALGGGIGVGITSTQTVTDTIMRKHVLKVIDAGAAAGDIHSPSRKTRKMIGQPLGQGTALGVEDTFGQNRDAMGDLLGHYANENKPAPVLTVSGGSRPTQEPRDSAIPGADSRLSGVAKQMAFGENPDAIAAGGARAVYDKQVMSWEAKPGVDITKIHDMAELNNSIQSPLNARQYGAMNAMQDNLDQPGLSRNSQMFGQRTQQNIMRNRPGAFDVAGQWADHTADQKDQAKALGENSADGQVNGMKSRFPQAFGAGEQLASQAQLGYKKKDQQNSPSAVWAGMAGNSVAGAVGGMNAGGPVMAMAGAGMASAAQAGAIGPLTDYGLKAGNTYVQAFSDGVSREITKGNFANLGEPANLGAGAMSKLAGTGLLRAGSGAATYKTPSGASGVVTLPPAITLNLVGAPIHLDGERIATIADQRIELAFDQATNTYQTL